MFSISFVIVQHHEGLNFRWLCQSISLGRVVARTTTVAREDMFSPGCSCLVVRGVHT